MTRRWNGMTKMVTSSELVRTIYLAMVAEAKYTKGEHCKLKHTELSIYQLNEKCIRKILQNL